MTIWLWIAFTVFILAMLALDLGVFNRHAHVIKVREALVWTSIWIALALLFVVFVYFAYNENWLNVAAGADAPPSGRAAAMEYLTGYLIEKSLSLDNIFVIALIFAYFRVAAQHQHRVLFWGVLGALVLRGVMIAAGVVLIRRFDWITYVFGGLLLATAIKMMISRKEEVDPDRNILVRLARRVLPVSRAYAGEHFFTRIDGRLAITPMFLVLLLVESSDVLFAVDSIPAIFAVTRDPFIVFTSNVFAILGLRSLYFALAGVLDRFRYLKHSLILLLAFIGVKMLLVHHFHVPTWLSLVIICAILGGGVVISLIFTRRDDDTPGGRGAPRSENGGAEGVEKPPAQHPVEVVRARKGRRRGPAPVEPGVMGWIRGHGRKIIVLSLGLVVIAIGIGIIPFPGPGSLVILAGLAILSTEFRWARRIMVGLKQRGRRLRLAFRKWRESRRRRSDTTSGAAKSTGA